MKKSTKILLILSPVILLIGLYLILSLISGSFCPPAGWQGPWPPWCEKSVGLGPFEYQELSYLPNENLIAKNEKILFGVGIHDSWGNPHILIDMGEDTRNLIEPTMKRLSTIGSNALLLTDFASFNKNLTVESATEKNAAGAFEINLDEMKKIVSGAKKNNQNKVFLTVNLYDSEYTYKKWLGQSLDESALEILRKENPKTLVEKIFPSWEEHIIAEAKKASEAGVDYLVINPTDTNFEYYADLDLLNEKYKALIPKIREEFKGKVGFFGSLPRLAGGKITALNEVDFTIIAFDVNADYFAKEMFKDVSDNITLVEAAFNNWLSHKNWQNVKSSEIYINILIPSYTGALETGWIEPSKTESDNSKWTSNFKEQAIGYESLFKALYAGNYKVNGIFSYGYWWSDQMYPVSKDLRNDLIQTIRHKDAESVFYKWSKILA